MNRRTFLKTSTLATLAVGAGAGRLFAESKAKSTEPKLPPPPLESITPPVLQNVSPNGATVFWGVSGPATGWVEYGETAALGQTARGAVDGLRPYDPRVLRIRIGGLLPGRKYFYRVHTAPVEFKTAYDIRRGAVVVSPVYAFTTFDPTASTARFTVWNDTHQRDETLAKLIDLLEAHPGDFHVWNGDIFDFINSEDVLVKQVLHPAGRAYAAERPLVFVRGNHDARGSYAREFARVIETPNGRSYYSFRQGPLACLVLDTGEDKDDAHPEYGGLNDFADYRREERRWMEQAIAQPEFQSAPFRVVFQHIPLRANGTDRYNDSRTQWEPLLARARIDFMFSGHVHTFAFREATTEQPFPLLIGGGPKPDQATFIHAQATEQLLDVQALALDGRELGHWTVPRRAP